MLQGRGTCQKERLRALLPVPAGNVNRSRLQTSWKPEEKKLKVKDGVERAECSLGKSATE